MAGQFLGLVKATHRLAAQDLSPTTTLAAEMFETAQWAQGSEAAASLAQMAARSAKGSPQLAGLVRERQDLVSEWQAKDKLLIAAKSEPPAKRKADAEKALADRLAAIDTRLAEIDRRLAQDFPDYAALASPAPVSVAEVQAQLGADEALVLFLDTPEWKPLPEETFIWVVTKSDVRWVRSDLARRRSPARWRRCVAASMRRRGTATGWRSAPNALGMPLDKAPSSGTAAALRSRPRPQALCGAVRRGAGPHQGQAPPDRAVRPADAASVPGARDQTADFRRPPCRSPGSPVITPSPSCPPYRRSRPCVASASPAPHQGR